MLNRGNNLVKEKRCKPKWHLVYFALAGFDLLAVCVSLGLNHHLAGLYRDSVEMNIEWTDRLDAISELAAITSLANVAGNDVFENHLADIQEDLFNTQVNLFNKKFQTFKDDLPTDGGDYTIEHAESFTEPLTQTRLGMTEMEVKAKNIFEMFRNGDAASAGAQMASFDRSYAYLNTSMASIRDSISNVIHDHLIAQNRMALFIKKLEIGVGSMIALMVLAIAFYGHRLSVVIRRMDEDKEAALCELKNQKIATDEHSIVSITDTHGTISYVNEKFCQISGYTSDELIGKNHRLLKSDEHPPEFFQDLWKTILRGDIWHGEIKNRNKDGRFYWVDSTFVPFKDEHGKITQYVSTRTDITAIKEAQYKLRMTAEHDSLTSLPNRTLFGARLHESIRRAEADPNYKFAILFFDFDRFKVINDSLGHNIGDALLVNIAKQFERCLRGGDTAARFGGDEFVVLLTSLDNYEQASSVAGRLLQTFALPHELLGHSVTSTASIGLVTNEQSYSRADEMIRDADAAMYQAKESGKNRVVVFDRVMHERAVDRLKLEADLRGALECDEFQLLYQPIIELSSGELSGFEALIRWEHPDRGTVSPIDFIPIAEDTGLIVDIGRWVLQAASRQAADWNRRLCTDRSLGMNVNVSKRQLLNATFRSDVLECQRQHALPAKVLKLEITESVIADDRIDIVTLLRQLRDDGFPIVMDDFGTGVSSLGALHDYPVDVLKIDRSFIRNLSNDRTLLAVVASITSLAENLGIHTVAEGIETQELVVAMQSIDCTWGQGYYFAKPMTAGDAEAYILRNREIRLSA